MSEREVSQVSGCDLFERALLAAYEVGLLKRAQLDARIARLATALRTDDETVLREGDLSSTETHGG